MVLEFVEPTGVPGKKIAVDEVMIGADTVQIAVSALVIQPDGGPPVLANTNNPFPITIISSALPTGAATAANQATMISSLSGIVSALGGSLVVATHAVTQSGAWTVELGATDNAVLDAIAAALAGTLTVGTHAVTQSGAWTVDLGAVDNAVLDAIAAALAGTLTVAATNLDIRDLTQVSDNVRVYANTAKDGSGTALIPLVDADGHLQIDVLSGGGGGTQYTEGDTDATITGTAILWEDTADTLRAVSAAKPLPVGDAGGSLTVDGTVAATQSGSWTVELGATDNAVLDAIALSLAGTLTVNTHAVTQSGLWDIGTVATVSSVAAVIPGTGATNLGKAVDNVAGATDTGIAPLFVRDDTLLTLTPVDGDYVYGRVNSQGALWTAVAASESHIGEVSGNTTPVAAGELTRPADTTAYAALDAVSDSTSTPAVLTFTNILRLTNGTGYLTKARIITDQSTCTARFRLHLFNNSPTAINDNSPQTLLYANATTWLGAITFPACATEGSGSTAAAAVNDTIRLAVKAAGSRNLYGLLETLDAFTPASSQKFNIQLTAEAN